MHYFEILGEGKNKTGYSNTLGPMMNKKQSLYIPCYNCEKQIVRVLNHIDDDILSSIDKIIVIDNKSVDQTVKAIRKFVLDRPEIKKKLILIEHKKNYGLGTSFKTAVVHASLSNKTIYTGFMEMIRQV